MVQPQRSYIVCTAPRTGSSLLCAALTQTRLAGCPAEYFDVHQHNEQHWRNTLAIKRDADYLDCVLNVGTTQNGVFGLKLHWHQIPALLNKLAAEQPRPDIAGDVQTAALGQILQDRLGDTQYIWLRRRNHVAQAISYYRAIQTDIWRVPVGSRADPQRIPSYNQNDIATYLRLVQQFDRSWYQLFLQQRLRALVVVYEDFIANYEKTLRGVLRFLGLDDGGLNIPTPAYRRQMDAVSTAWESTFRSTNRGVVTKNEPRFAPDRATRSRARKRQPSPAKRGSGPLPLISYDVGAGIDFKLEPAPAGRDWMNETPGRFVYRCLPLLIANQTGWLLRNTHRFTVIWDGASGVDALKITYTEPCRVAYASSHFGCGVLTFSVGRLFRTPPGYNLHVRGPANLPKDGIAPLEGVVEADWCHASFTMNWKLTRPNTEVTFEVDEPIAMIQPVLRGDVERFQPELRLLADDPAWEAGHRAWSVSRTQFNAALKARNPDAIAAGWQRHYLVGVTLNDTEAPEHQTGLSLAPLVDKRSTDGHS